MWAKEDGMARARNTKEILEMLEGTFERMKEKLGSARASAGYCSALAVRDNPNDMDGPKVWYDRFMDTYDRGNQSV